MSDSRLHRVRRGLRVRLANRGRTTISVVGALALALLAGSPGCTQSALGGYTARVDPTIRYQTLEGWGTSLAWWANVVGGFPDSIRQDYIRRIFSVDGGLGLNVVRYNIGGGENPAYHFLQYRAAVPGYEPSPGMWEWSADARQRRVLTEAMKSGANRVEAFSDSPPYWMTLSGSVTGGRNGINNLDPSRASEFADYLAEVVKHFHDAWGITFRTVEPLNEPSGNWWKFGHWQEGCRVDREVQSRLIWALSAALHARRLRTGVSAPDENWIDGTLDSFESYNPAARSSQSRINTHSYGGNRRTELLNAAVSFAKGLWMSEYGDGDPSGLTMSRRILKDMKELQPTAWVYWQAVDGGGWGLLVNSERDENDTAYTVNEKYYVLANYSRFIRPGARFIAIDDPNSLCAYEPRKHRLVIVTTGGKTDSPVVYDLSALRQATGIIAAYRTSAQEHLVRLPGIALSGKQFVAVAKSESVTTYVLDNVRMNGRPGLSPYSFYRLLNRGSGLAMDVSGNPQEPGAAIVQSKRSENWSQEWSVAGLGQGDYRLVNRASGMVLDVDRASPHAGSGLIEWRSNGGENQEWHVVPLKHGWFGLINRHSALALDVSGGSREPGVAIVQAAPDGSPSQQWKLERVKLTSR